MRRDESMQGVPRPDSRIWSGQQISLQLGLERQERRVSAPTQSSAPSLP